MTGYLAAMHQIKGDYFGYFTEDEKLRFATWKEAFFHMFEQLLRDAAERTGTSVRSRTIFRHATSTGIISRS